MLISFNSQHTPPILSTKLQLFSHTREKYNDNIENISIILPYIIKNNKKNLHI